MSKKILYLVPFLCLLASCISMGTYHHEPGEEYKALVLGQMSIILTNPDSSSFALGEHRSGLLIEIDDMQTGKKINLKTNYKGFFSSAGMKPGKYIIRKVEMKGSRKSSTNYTRTTSNYSMSVRLNRSFVVEEGVVCNLGVITLTENDEGTSFLPTYGSYELNKELFTKRYPKSLWLDHNWVNAQ